MKQESRERYRANQEEHRELERIVQEIRAMQPTFENLKRSNQMFMQAKRGFTEELKYPAKYKWFYREFFTAREGLMASLKPQMTWLVRASPDGAVGQTISGWFLSYFHEPPHGETYSEVNALVKEKVARHRIAKKERKQQEGREMLARALENSDQLIGGLIDVFDRLSEANRRTVLQYRQDMIAKGQCPDCHARGKRLVQVSDACRPCRGSGVDLEAGYGPCNSCWNINPGGPLAMEDCPHCEDGKVVPRN